MRWRQIFALAVVLLLCLSLSVSAQTTEMYNEQLKASGADRLVERLPEDAQALLEALELDGFAQDGFTQLELSSVLNTLLSALQKNTAAPLQALLSLLAVVVLSAMFGGLQGLANRTPLRQTYHTVSVLAAAGLLLTAVGSLLRTVQAAVDSVNVFMLSFVPVYGVIVASGGSPTAALSYQTTLLTAAELFTQGVRGVVLPILLVSLALGCVGTVADGFCLSSFSTTFYKLVLWGLGLFSTVFSGVLSVQQMVAAAGDSVSSRALKFSLASFVPVVGGVLSEAYSTVMGCAGLLRSTVGGFGLVATAVIILPSLLSCVGWSLCLSLGGNAAALFKLDALEKLCRCVGGAVRVLIAVLAVLGLMMIVSTSVVAFAGRR